MDSAKTAGKSLSLVSRDTAHCRVPSSTYRLQFNADFTFEQATAIVDYLRKLGIGDCYASPIFHASPNSTHGYDICQFNELNPSLGGEAGFEGLVGRLQENGMGLLLDMVPNHMGCHGSNSWWMDVLRHGRASKFADYFDIDWEAPHTPLKVLLPVLEDDFDKVLAAGKLKLDHRAGKFAIVYHDRTFPLAPESITAKETAIKELVQRYNSDPAGKLRELLEAQHYRLAYWRTGMNEINYRRFFDVMGLVSVRIEKPEVFHAAHEFILRLISDGKVTGLRIDHPDGLWDPGAYFQRLQKAAPSLYVVAEKILSDEETLPTEWPLQGTTGYDFLNRANGLFVQSKNEKQFGDLYERFTGESADFRGVMSASKEQVLLTSFPSELNALARRLENLAEHYLRHLPAHRNADFQSAVSRISNPPTHPAIAALRNAILAVAVTFPVYRTYINEGITEVTSTDRGYILQALRDVRAVMTNVNTPALDFLEKTLLLDLPGDLQSDARTFVMKFQQLTGPAMAKGLEDTAFYRFNRFISLNEVGGDPGQFGISVEAFHEYNCEQQVHWQHALLATATHDTKRGEDVRARLNVLSEIPDEWAAAASGWSELNRLKKTRVDGHPAPSANDEYQLYQTLVGAWPADFERRKDFSERVSAYMLKATREAKLRTSWLDPNAQYEEATARFVDAILGDGNFLRAFTAFQQKIAFFGILNSLSQVVLKLTCPGVPDFYQGTEFWDFSLVDPDNRRPVDYKLRQRLLDELPSEGALPLLLENPSKLHVIHRLLEFRRKFQPLFDYGDYVPLSVSGAGREHACAFARVLNQDQVVVIVPRFVCTLTAGKMTIPSRQLWADTSISHPILLSSFRNIITGESLQAGDRIPVGDALSTFPVAVLATAMR